MAIGVRGVGDFCWINVLTPDPDKSRAFFSTLLKWTYVAMPSTGHRILVRGKDIGGIFNTISPRTPEGANPGIGVMIKSGSADKAVARVKTLGGTAMPAFDVGIAGRMAVCFDPNGAEFDIWEPKSMEGFQVDSTHHGAPSWFEISTPNVPRDREFYSALFGWTATEFPMGSVKYTAFSRGREAPIAGMLVRPPAKGLIRAQWGVYFTVQNVNETAKLAELMRAQIHLPPQDFPGVGRFCYIRSPEGVYFYVITYL